MSSNPLLDPGDRFRRAELSLGPNDANPFAESEPIQAEEADSKGGIYASSSEVANSFRPAYLQTLEHRGVLIFTLGVVALMGGLVGSIGYFATTGELLIGFPVCLLTGILAIRFANLDLEAMNVGAMDKLGRTKTLIGMWISIAALCLAVLVFATYLYSRLNA